MTMPEQNSAGSAREFLRELTALLRPYSGEPEQEARELIRHFAGLGWSEILTGREISAKKQEEIRAAAARRRAGEPLQYILGEWAFYGRSFQVGKGVLIPRADTETLVEAGLAFLRGRKGSPAVGDLCAGSGCVGISLKLACPSARVYELELSEEALPYLERNAALLGAELHIRREDVLCPKESYPDFDLILANPPYIPRTELAGLQKELFWEPEMALCGGTDGLDFYRGITQVWKKKLKPGGMLAYEIGKDQEEAVRKIFENECFENVCFHRDLCGIIRVVTALLGKPRPG